MFEHESRVALGEFPEEYLQDGATYYVGTNFDVLPGNFVGKSMVGTIPMGSLYEARAEFQGDNSVEFIIVSKVNRAHNFGELTLLAHFPELEMVIVEEGKPNGKAVS